MGKSNKNIIDRLTEPNTRLTRANKHKRRKLKNYMNYIYDEIDEDWDPDMDDDKYDDDDDDDDDLEEED